ncbi:MAG: hypothetical protein EA350_12940 [Gemmatimonadales bacterium]|nr:MAG: hypothetical protein EA350_12940 [Gemmatimonadales bacterium]
MASSASSASSRRILLGFLAGFVAVLVCHQGMLAILVGLGVSPRTVFPYGATEPFGVPQIWSSAFWGGIWGMLFAGVEQSFPRGPMYWITWLLGGAFLVAGVAFFVVAPLQGNPVAAGGDPAAIVTGMMVNAAWGLGTAILLLSLDAWRRH